MDAGEQQTHPRAERDGAPAGASLPAVGIGIKVLVALETCDHPKYAERRALVERTWAKRLPANFDFEVFTGARLGCGDGYDDLCQKTRAIVAWALARRYDWLLIVDDDVFVRTEKLTLPSGDYAGLYMADLSGDLWCSGGCYWLSRRAMEFVRASPFHPCLGGSQEDRWVGWALRNAGIRPARYDVALKPCDCGQCRPETPPAEWTAYIIDPQYAIEIFMGFEARYGG